VHRRHHHDRDVLEALGGLELAADLEPVDLREHAVQDHEVGHRLPDLGQRLAPCARGEHAVALRFQEHLDHPQHARIVVHGQDGLGLFHGGRARGRGGGGAGRAAQALDEGQLLHLVHQRFDDDHLDVVGGAAPLRSRRHARGVPGGSGHPPGGRLLHVRAERLLARLEGAARLHDRVLDARVERDHGGETRARLELDLGDELLVVRVRHRDLQARPLDLDREHEVALAQVEGHLLEQLEVDLLPGEVDAGHAELAAQVGHRELLGQRALPDEDAGQPLAERLLRGQRVAELPLADQVRLAQDRAEALPRHARGPLRSGSGPARAALPASR
jgi:hypothetical protein